MIIFAYKEGFFFAGKFYELIIQLFSIERKDVTLKEYIESYRRRLN